MEEEGKDEMEVGQEKEKEGKESPEEKGRGALIGSLGCFYGLQSQGY